jgi:hypothetical protein
MINQQQQKKRALLTKKMPLLQSIQYSQADAEAAIKELQQSSFDVKKLPIVGRDYHNLVTLNDPPVGMTFPQSPENLSARQPKENA